VIAVCPEVAGGLPTPRAAAEIPGGQGIEVSAGKRPVFTTEWRGRHRAFVSGARQALALVQLHGIRIAILKANSPSCGNRLTYDGSFSGNQSGRSGRDGRLLSEAGVQVFSELELEDAAKALEQ
jgi:uncharacterized protein YbbK (DUF523 family)